MSAAAPIPAWTLSPRASLRLDGPRVLAIINCTPDSFSDGGAYPDLGAAVDACEQRVAEGADALDIGGESTRPGAVRVPPDEQARRLLPLLLAIRRRPAPLGVIPISVDTTLASVAARALDAGADAINDVSAGTEDPAIFGLAAAHGAALVLMHRLRPPTQDSYSDSYLHEPQYGDVVADVRDFLSRRAHAALEAGVRRESIAVDPGLGFGKTVAQNLELVRRTAEIAALGYPVLSGASRKSFVGRVSLGADSRPADRLAGSLAVSVAHYLAGARIFRVHDVAAQVQALRLAARLGPPTAAAVPSPGPPGAGETSAPPE